MSTQTIAKHLVDTSYSSLPEDVIMATKRSILDTLGVMIAASTLEQNCINLYQLMREAGGKQESTLVGFGGKLPCWTAALINGGLAHGIDYDDCIGVENPLVHPTGSVLPAALAVAERVGKVSGKNFINAIALAIDFFIRLASCPKGDAMKDYPFFTITTFGVFGATAVSGKLLGLSETKMANAVGIAVNRVSGIKDAIGGTDFRAIRDGFTNHAGVISALMADRGIGGYVYAVEKLFEAYYNGMYNPEALTLNLGKMFRGVETGYKPWPSCGETHPYIQAVLQAVKEYNIQPEDITEVILTGSKSGQDLANKNIGRASESSINAKQSIPFVVGVAAIHGNVTMAHFLSDNLKDARVLEMAGKVKFITDNTVGEFTSKVEIKTKGMKSYYSSVDKLLGSILNPLSTDDLITKFRDCARFSSKPLPSDKIETVINKILNLEDVENISEITHILE